MASTSMLLDDPLPDTIPLTGAERARLAELETIVQTHLETFFGCGQSVG
jgi:hypothetical protein